MALNWIKHEKADFVIGTRETPVTLTANFEDNVSVPITFDFDSQQTLWLLYTPGSGGTGNQVEIKIEITRDEIDGNTEDDIWGQETLRQSDLDTNQMTYTFVTHLSPAGTAGELMVVPITDPIHARGIRYSIREVGGNGSAGTAALRALISG